MNTAVSQESLTGLGYPLISVERARMAAVAGVLPVAECEIVSLALLPGRVLDEPVVSKIDIPPFDQSAMDGYAVRAQDCSANNTSQRITGRRAAGDRPGAEYVGPGTALRVMTGAAVPEGANAIVKWEDCVIGGETVVGRQPPMPGDNLRRSGEDVPAGSQMLDRGALIDARHIAILAAAGVTSAQVKRKVRVGLLSTGNEIYTGGDRIPPGNIHDSNKPMLTALLQKPGVIVCDLGTVRDDAGQTAAAFREAAKTMDVIISTGGVSAGEEDHVRTAVETGGGYLDHLNAAIKPGKPASIGKLGSTVILALPGNPLSALVTFFWFGRPVVEKRMGHSSAMPVAVRAKSGFHETRKPGRDEFVPIIVNRDQDGSLIASKLGRGGAARLSPLIAANGLGRIPGYLERIDIGDPLDVYLFEHAFSL